jgi:hypothetical protein
VASWWGSRDGYILLEATTPLSKFSDEAMRPPQRRKLKKQLDLVVFHPLIFVWPSVVCTLALLPWYCYFRTRIQNGG